MQYLPVPVVDTQAGVWMLALKIGLQLYFYGMKFKFSFEFTVSKCVLFGYIYRWTNCRECTSQGFKGETSQMSLGDGPRLIEGVSTVVTEQLINKHKTSVC